MKSNQEYKVSGFISQNPFEFKGFIKPVFTSGSHYWEQSIERGEIHVNEVDPIGDLSPCHENIIWPIEVKLWAFAFDKSDIVYGNYDNISKFLFERINDLPPMQRIEVLEFLGREKDYLVAIENVASKFKILDCSIGENWRKRNYDRVLAEFFIGRKNEIQIFSTFLNTSNSNALTVHTNGEGGIGKTQLLKNFQNICKNCGYAYTENLIDLYHSDSRSKIDIMRLVAENLSFGDFSNFRDMLCKYTDASSEIERRSIISELENSFAECYQNLKILNNDPIVIFFDTYEVIQGGDFSRWLEDVFFLKLISLNYKTKIVISGRFPVRKFSAQVIELKPFSLSESEDFLQRCLYLPAKSAIPEKLGGEESAEIVHGFSQGQPIILALFADWCNYEHNYLNTPELMKEISQSVEAGRVSPYIFKKILISKISFLREPENIAIPYMAFAYRRMTPEMLSFISNISLENSRNILLSILRPLSFIKYKEEKTVLLHDVMRDMVNRYYWEKADPEGIIRKKIAERLVEYYGILLKEKSLSELQRAEYTTERRYYQLYLDDRESFQDFIKDFDEKIENYQLYYCEEIVDQTFYEKLSIEQQLEIDVRRIWWRNEAYATEEAQRIIRELKSNPEKREILNGNDRLKAYFSQEEGVIKHWSNEYKESIEHFKYAEEIFRKYNISYRMLWALNWLGYSYYRSGNLDKAESIFKKGINEFLRYTKLDSKKPDKNYVIIAMMYGNLNAVLRHKGRFFEASQYGEVAVGIARKKNNHRELARYLNSLGETYKNLNKNYEASIAYDEALQHLKIAPDPLLMARILIGKALIDYSHADYIYVLEFYRKANRYDAITYFNKIHSSDDALATASAFNNLKEAEKILSNLDNDTNELADLYFYQAEVATIKGEWAAAEAIFKKSESIANAVHNEYRWIDALIGQIICHYFLNKEGQGYDKKIEKLVNKINNAQNEYHNLLGKMNIFLGNICFDKFLSTKSFGNEDLKNAIEHYVTACHHMFKFTRVTRYRFWSSFQVLTKRIGDIPLDLLNKSTLESLRSIWLYDESRAVCQEYSNEFNEILDFAITRLNCFEDNSLYHKKTRNYEKNARDGINRGGKYLRFAPAYALMALQLKIDRYDDTESAELAGSYAELARSYATNDNIFEAQRNSDIALEHLKDESGSDLIKAYIYTGLATILFRRGEYAKLLTRSSKEGLEKNLNLFKEKMKEKLTQANNAFQLADRHLSEAKIYSISEDEKLLRLQSHLYSRKAEYLFLNDKNDKRVEGLFKKAINKAELVEEAFGQMAGISSLVRHYYFTDQWKQRSGEITLLIDKFYYLSRKYRSAPVLSGRIESIKADLKYDQIPYHEANRQLVWDAFRGYIVSSRVNSKFSYKHFFEVITSIIDRIATLPKRSSKILLEELPMLKQEAPRGDISEDAYEIVEQALYIHSEVL